MEWRWNPPPNWPQPPSGWSPPPLWRPDPTWGPPPAGWQLWTNSPVPKTGRRSSAWTWPAVITLVLFFPVGLMLMWVKTGWAKPVKWAITGFIALLVIVSAATPPQVEQSRKQPTAESGATAPTPTPRPNADADEEGTAAAAPVDTTNLSAAAAAAGAKQACRKDALANVYHADRLQVIAACTTVSGTVQVVRHEEDGDVHFDLALDAQYKSMLVEGNTTHQHGWLVVELVPADEPGCVTGHAPRPSNGSYDYGVCTGANLITPNAGEHVWVTGPYVIDTLHGWAEVHPAWNIAATAPVASRPTVIAVPAPAASTRAPAPPPPTTRPPATENLCGAPQNPYGYNFCGRGSLLSSPSGGVCGYFNCINNFSNGTGYMVECTDATYSMSGGRRGACSYHGGVMRPVYG